MQSVSAYQSFFVTYLENQVIQKEPQNLYEPIQYILSLGGKRMRPVLTLMSAEVFDTNYQKALPAAMAVEVFHNFSLVHDDIMDAVLCEEDTKRYMKSGIPILGFCLAMRC